MKINRFVLSVLMLALFAVEQTAFGVNHIVEWGETSIVPAGLSNVVLMTSGAVANHSLALNGNGSIVVWGDTSHGESVVPPLATNVIALAGGWGHDLALKANGTVVAWGNNFSYFTNGPSGQTNVPAGLTGVKAIGAGWYHSLAVRTNGTVVAWGANEYGQSTVPTNLTDVVAVVGGPARTLALKGNGTIVTWGTNAGTDGINFTPYAMDPPPGTTNVTKMAAGYFHSLALKADATVIAWGANDYGQCTVPPGLSNVIAVAAGAYHSIALKSDGTVVVWGLYSNDLHKPPAGLTNVIAISAGYSHTLALVNGPTPPPPGNPVLAGPITNPANGHAYYLLTATNWHAAQQIAVSLGGYLATINNAAENNWVFTNFSAFGGVERSLWLGMTDADQEQSWAWVDGEAVNYFNWAVGEPNGTVNTGANEDYVMMWYPSSGAPLGSWNDAPPDMLNFGVVEVGAAEPAAPVVLMGPITNSANGHAYFLLNYLSWPAAEQYAVGLGGHLATIDDAAENQWIYDTFSGYENGKRAMWIGLNDSAVEGTWAWVSGAPVTYLNFSPGEPNNGMGVFLDEDAVVMWNASSGYPAGTWNDAGSNQLQSAVIEIPAPAFIAPTITMQPTNVTVNVGGSAFLLAGATGTQPLSYQWRFYDVDLPGKTSSFLSIQNAQLTNGGVYTLVVSNIVGAVTSAPAVLTVTTPSPPVIVSQPTNLTVVVGSNAVFRVTATGGQVLTYRWRFNGTNLSSATSSALTLTNVQLINAGLYSVVVSNLSGSITSSPALLSVTSLTACAPVFANMVSWWRMETNSLDSWGPNNGSQSVKFTTGEVGQAMNASSGFMQVPDSASLHITNAISVEAWVNPNLSVGNGARTILGKSDNFDRVPLGTNTSFLVGLTNGTRPYFMVSPNGSPRTNTSIVAPFSIPTNQWSFIVATYNGSLLRLYVNGTLVAQSNYTAGIFSSTSDVGIGGILYLGSQALPFNGLIDEVSLYNRALTDGEIVSIYNADGTGKCFQPPTIVAQSGDQSIPQGEDVKFTVDAVGSKPLSFQWFFQQSPIIGGTNASLILEKIRTNQAGFYQLRVTNTFGFALSASMRLTVLPPPSCTPPPAGLISWWPGDGNLGDVLGTNNIQTFSSTYVTGKVDRAFNFNAALQSRIQVPNSPSLNFGSNADFSIEMWVKAAATNSFNTNVPLFEKRSEGGAIPWLGYSLALNQGRLAFSMGSAPQSISNISTFASSGPDLRDTIFHHVAVTVDRDVTNGGKLYVDGQVVLTFDPTKNKGSLTNTQPVIMGSPFSFILNNAYSGLIDEPAIYSRALSDAEILAIKTAGAAGKCKVPPSIITQPVSQKVTLGSNATFSVVANGSPLLRYQWLRNGTSIPLATNASYTFPASESSNPAGPGDLYSVRVTNLFGTVVSSNVLLQINHRPTLQVTNLITDEDVAVAVPIIATDADNDPLTFIVVAQPTNGSLRGTIPNLSYSSNPNFSGTDSFRVKVNDGMVDSFVAIINVTILPVNDAPFARSQSVALDEDSSLDIVLGAFDVENDPLTFDIVTPPAHGTLSGTLPNVTYRPNTNYFGPDSFTFKVNDGQLDSNPFNPGLVSITVRPVNDAPVARITISPLTDFPGFTNQIILAPASGDADVVLDGSASSDVENDPLQFSWWEGTNNFASGAVVTNGFAPDTHQVTLIVSDGQATGTNSTTFEVVSPAQSVGLLISLLQDGNPGGKNQPLLASLNNAVKAFDRGNVNTALNELNSFQNKVRAQIAPSNPELAEQLDRAAQTIINNFAAPEEKIKGKGRNESSS